MGAEAEVVARLVRIEELLVTGRQLVEERLRPGQQVLQALDDGLVAYRRRVLADAHIAERARVLDGWSAKIRADTGLGFPHRKILEFLASQCDLQMKKFKEVHFSRLVKEARLGKNRASGYLVLLEQKGYVHRRSDGYRTFFKLRQPLAE